jgi:putative CocE/NonD family hydrolase
MLMRAAMGANRNFTPLRRRQSMTTASEPKYKVVVEKNLAMRTRDGVTLYADVYRPDGAGKFPVLVMRTPYDKGQQLALTEKDYFPPRGYVLLVQDTRGRFSSGGDFYPFVHEAADGYDTVEWASGLPWSNGKVGMVGQSYLALVQYYAAAMAPPHLVATCPVSGPVTYYENCVYRHGVFELGWILCYFTFMARNTLLRKGIYDAHRERLDSYLARPDMPLGALKNEVYGHLPVTDWAERLRDGAPYLADMLKNWNEGPYWAETDLRPLCRNVMAPAMHTGSWYDAFQFDTLAMYTQMRRDVVAEKARRGQRLIMGPWAHLLPYSVPTSRGTGDIDFGPEAKVELLADQERFLHHWLGGTEDEILDEAPVKIFVMGENRWRDEREWPLARTNYTKLYLRSRGRANSIRGDGALSFNGPGDESADEYVYDPNDPVPTRGGTTLGLPPGVYDQTEIEQREDVLVYTSEALAKDLEVTGPISMRLHAASSARDTDFVAKLVDVRPSGYAQNIAEGVVRARLRDSGSAPTLITAGTVYDYAIDLWSTSHVFRAGHRLRLEVSSSNFPRYDRNSNTGNALFTDRELRTARQSVFHSERYPSHLVLPVIPR